MSDDKHRADLTKPGEGRTVIHVAGFHGHDGEPSVLAVSALLDTTSSDPDCVGVIVGEPARSPLLDVDGQPPHLGGFMCGPDAADRLAHELIAAAAMVRATRRG